MPSKAVSKNQSVVLGNRLLHKKNPLRCYGDGDCIDRELRDSSCSDKGAQIFGV